MAVSTSRKPALILLAIAAVAAGLAILVHRADAEDRDRRAVRGFVWDLERKLRAEGGAAWLLSEGAFPSGQGDPEAEPARDRLRADLDRLARLDRIQILPGDIAIHAETATADYTVGGNPRPGDPQPPRRGRLVLRRTREGWRLASNRFLDESEDAGPPAPTTGSRRRFHRHAKESLDAVLGSTAVLALLASAFLIVKPFVTRTARGRRARRRRR